MKPRCMRSPWRNGTMGCNALARSADLASPAPRRMCRSMTSFKTCCAGEASWDDISGAGLPVDARGARSAGGHLLSKSAAAQKTGHRLFPVAEDIHGKKGLRVIPALARFAIAVAHGHRLRGDRAGTCR